MQVFPDSEIRILRNCPCDPDYEHTLYFANATAQKNYFVGLTKYVVTDATYQRAKRGRIRVPYKCDNLYDCNYLMFQNTAFGNKWFYAFIDDLTYVNNVTTEITYTIDVMQSWLFDFSLQQCFVAREHSATDNIGDNLVGENLPVGEMIGSGVELAKNDSGSAIFRDWVIVVATGANELNVANPGGFYGRLYSQVEYTVYNANADGISQLSSWLNTIKLLDNQNIVASIFMMPRAMIAAKDSSPSSGYYSVNMAIPERKTLKRSDGSNVKNNKLMTYPYTYLEISNMQGEVKIYPYELFNTKDITFHCFVDTSLSPSFVAIPTNYRGNQVSPDDRITLSNFPVCPWSTSNILSTITDIGVKGALLALTSLSLPGTAGTAGKVFSKYPPLDLGVTQQLENKSLMVTTPAYTSPVGVESGVPSTPATQPALTNKEAVAAYSILRSIPTGNGSIGHGGECSMFNAGYFSLTTNQRYPQPEFIDMIDDYFSRYGYATNKIKTPSINSRPHWNYVQTVGCKVNGSIPCNDERTICAIFDKGVTFWKNPSEVGNFSLDNSPPNN